jgi:hypothetical protein
MEDVIIRTDGWRAYRSLVSNPRYHEPTVVGCGPNAVKVLPRVHALIPNAKGNLRGVHHGVAREFAVPNAPPNQNSLPIERLLY